MVSVGTDVMQVLYDKYVIFEHELYGEKTQFK